MIESCEIVPSNIMVYGAQKDSTERKSRKVSSSKLGVEGTRERGTF